MIHIFLRWLRIVTLCRIGLHKAWMKTPLTPEITITECECCHLSYVARGGQVYNFNRPDPLIAARGLLDRQGYEADAPINQDAIPASARGWRLHTPDPTYTHTTPDDHRVTFWDHNAFIDRDPITDAHRDWKPDADADFDSDFDGH